MSRSKSRWIWAATAAIVLSVALISSEHGAPALEASSAGSGRIGIYLTSHALSLEEVVRAFLDAKAEGKIDTLVINVKNMHGEITYASSVPMAQQIGAVTGRIDFRLLIPELHRRGFYVIARQVLFFDPKLANALGLATDWVPADLSTAVEYNLAVADEVADLGFDEIQFDYVRFADEGALIANYEDRYDAVEAFLCEAHVRMGDRVRISADLFGRVLWPWNQKRIDPIGQSLEGVCPHLDHVSPMLYPSHYVEESYRNDPYQVIYDALTGANERVDASFRPFLQAFDMAIPNGMSLETYIAEQIRAAQDCGADGYLFWHPACDYTALYDVL